MAELESLVILELNQDFRYIIILICIVLLFPFGPLFGWIWVIENFVVCAVLLAGLISGDEPTMMLKWMPNDNAAPA